MRASLTALLTTLPTLICLATEHPHLTPPDLEALIECRQRAIDYAQLVPLLEDPPKATTLGWHPLPATNPFMTEYTLHTPIHVFGYQTKHIALSGGSIIAILDLTDPRPLARTLRLDTAIDTPKKTIFGRELTSTNTTNPKTGQPAIESIVLNVSNVTSHPGKTLVGCTYSLDDP
ncbi:hypothetical protein D1605_009555 [Xylella fastidiosa subsp. fastidiosa]|uniref:Uncharacterized protein n=2 Tax=Xylella fastidiosa TaxID=2371 RepID=Q87AP1_XYLFT|nr:hypothetical protein [Xylella fastidiosa]ADN62648.1 hypothetical protein XFLM_03295 [Xylella fastidiosa subsp. fastidiosa GB514]KAF0571415.1 hypothetical protein P305_04385 [Xylella fastidiosa subsp. fastidiosa Mus-1]AAO29616.1 conserved hypothetical protein [Xylella fastidiosa Temecula1]ACB93285.1 conserved hypothetical protein [Xylella fastidiosa M23]EGO81699.1 hypothetical protein XFEB_01392 [Xylella fastidiosa EB92.1]